ncbi:putative SKP1/BTB/POZ domain superfamily, NPH3/RPT2-like family protein [Helianthus anomalus]
MFFGSTFTSCKKTILKTESSQLQMIKLVDFHGVNDAFELGVKFSYGITITLRAYNIVAARCAAKYLQLTEDVEKGNLVH